MARKNHKGNGKKFGMSRLERLWLDYEFAESEGNERRMESLLRQIEELEGPETFYDQEQRQKRGK